MRGWLGAIALLAGCKGTHGEEPPALPQPTSVARQGRPPAPAVAEAGVLAQDTKRPPMLLLVEGPGRVRPAVAASWADLDVGRYTVAKQFAPLVVALVFAHETALEDPDPVATIQPFDEYAEHVDLASLEMAARGYEAAPRRRHRK